MLKNTGAVGKSAVAMYSRENRAEKREQESAAFI